MECVQVYNRKLYHFSLSEYFPSFPSPFFFYFIEQVFSFSKYFPPFPSLFFFSSVDQIFCFSKYFFRQIFSSFSRLPSISVGQILSFFSSSISWTLKIVNIYDCDYRLKRVPIIVKLRALPELLVNSSEV